jgi:undecaprenyl diphosphate synthase
MPKDSAVDLNRLPRHVAIIMDGNGRWAEKRNEPRLFGHKAGAESVRDIVEAARELGIEVLTLYAFSSENWNRPVQEVSGLMMILKKFLISELSRMQKNGIRLSCIGEMEKLPLGVRETLLDSITTTSSNTEMVLNLALSYGARDEITRAVRLLAEECTAGRVKVSDITVELVNSYLYTADMPDPDLLIRTGGEARLSNFLLWQLSYAEIYFTDVMWPDFRRDIFLKAIADFQKRERRYGRTGAQLKKSH